MSDIETIGPRLPLGEYRLATGDNRRELHAEVALCVSLGYVPQGGVAITGRSYYLDGYKREGVLFAQAMWKSSDLVGGGA